MPESIREYYEKEHPKAFKQAASFLSHMVDSYFIANGSRFDDITGIISNEMFRRPKNLVVNIFTIEQGVHDFAMALADHWEKIPVTCYQLSSYVLQFLEDLHSVV